jgi:hypothetical protein
MSQWNSRAALPFVGDGAGLVHPSIGDALETRARAVVEQYQRDTMAIVARYLG